MDSCFLHAAARRIRGDRNGLLHDALRTLRTRRERRVK